MNEISSSTETAILAGGCFWCTESVFLQLRGVHSVESGYMGGHLANPTYEQVCSGETGHAEVIRIVFDPAQISFSQLLDVFFATHDPTTLNRQGEDVGTQYRSAIFPQSDAQAEQAKAAIAHLNSEVFDGKIVTAIEPNAPFYAAEDYHQNYFNRNPQNAFCSAVIPPKVAKLRAKFTPLLRQD